MPGTRLRRTRGGGAGTVLAVLLLLALRGSASPVLAQRPVTPADDDAGDDQSFDGVRTIFQSHCTHCHGQQTRKAELNLSTPDGVLRGSDSGPVIVAGKPDESRLWQLVSAEEMPPEGEPRLSASEIERVRRWIAAGARLGTEAAHIQPDLNQHDVLPILLLHCATCHGRQTQEAGLDVRSKQAMLLGGKSGPALVPGQPDKSLIVRRINAGEMPPPAKLASHSVKPVDPDELEKLIRWIKAGAPEVDVKPDVASTDPDPLVNDNDRDFWSFQPPRRPPVPDTGAGAPLRNPIDAYVEQSLIEHGLTLSGRANRLTLLRRAYFDLIGLPPDPEEVESFAADYDPQSYERLIDRLLSSPHYGERWGQYWLDLAGYADSEGVQHSDPIRPHAYRYRDYVIRALNDDKPYDRFLLEQIAGDELADYEHAQVITDDVCDNLVATGFLRMSADGTFAGITGFVPNRLDVIDDQLRILSSAVMGLTIRCARCHSHKFDPIPQRDYYRLAAVFKGAMDEHDWLKPIGDSRESDRLRYLTYVTTAERQEWETRDHETQRQIDTLKKELDDNKEDEDSKKDVDQRIKALEGQRRPQPMIRALWDRGEPSPTYVLRRGDYRQPSRLVGPGVPSVLTDGKTPLLAHPPWPGAKKTGNRLALAKWLIQPDHPLTARVIVNRLWHHHFGRGIVETLDDFGRAGARPCHPELLDWLAVEFVRSGWSVKHMHRLMMTSATYQQRSAVTPDHERLDPENRLLSRMPLKRMDAEVLWDTLLAVADRLDPTPFGPAEPVQVREDGLVVAAGRASRWRRSIYVIKRRTEPLTILDDFDRPRMTPNCVQRPVSSVAPQALHLMNSGTIHELSLAFADRILADAGNNDLGRQVDRAYRIALGRPPMSDERAVALESIRRLQDKWNTHLEGSGSVPKDDAKKDSARMALANLCHALTNSAAFLYVD